jgi:hypothetical protein
MKGYGIVAGSARRGRSASPRGFCLATQIAAGGIDRIAASLQGAAFGLITRGLRVDARRATHSGAPSYWWERFVYLKNIT